MGCRGLLYSVPQSEEVSETDQISQPTVWRLCGAPDGGGFQGQDCSMVPSSIALRATSGVFFFALNFELSQHFQLVGCSECDGQHWAVAERVCKTAGG